MSDYEFTEEQLEGLGRHCSVVTELFGSSSDSLRKPQIVVDMRPHSRQISWTVFA